MLKAAIQQKFYIQWFHVFYGDLTQFSNVGKLLDLVALPLPVSSVTYFSIL